MPKTFKYTNMTMTDTLKAKELIKQIIEKVESLKNDDILMLLEKKLGSAYTVRYENNYFTKNDEFTISKTIKY